MTFSEYIENLAERHVDIRHKKNDEVHFFSSEREKHTALDSVLHYPAVILDRGSGFGYGGGPGAYRKGRNYLLFVVEHVSDTSDYVQIETVLERCERILDEILNQILEDKRKEPPMACLLTRRGGSGLCGELRQPALRSHCGNTVVRTL